MKGFTGTTRYTNEEIAKLLQFCDARLKAVVLFLASTGSRVGSLTGLRLRNLVPIQIEQYKLYKITIYESSRDEYYTFCTPEARSAIDEYLDYRKRSGERLGPNSPLFRKHFDAEDPNSINNPRSLSTSGLQTALDYALARAGLRTTVSRTDENDKITGRIRKEVARFHGFRKYAITNMKNAGVDFSDREYLVGHRKSRGLDVNYDRTSEQDRLSQYIKSISALTIDDSQRLELKVEDLEKKNSEIELMKIEMKKQAEMIQGFANDCSNSYANDRIAEDQKMEIARLEGEVKRCLILCEKLERRYNQKGTRKDRSSSKPKAIIPIISNSEQHRKLASGNQRSKTKTSEHDVLVSTTEWSKQKCIVTTISNSHNQLTYSSR